MELELLTLQDGDKGNQWWDRILNHAANSNINIHSLSRDVIDKFIKSYKDISAEFDDFKATETTLPFSTATRIDTHAHPVPEWFRELSPLAAGRDTPSYSAPAHLQFMASHGIKRSILSISTPQANVYHDDLESTKAFARLLNEHVAELVRTYPARFSFMAVVPLPYVEEAMEEARYALDTLGAVGITVMTNHGGMYPGDDLFWPFWNYLHGRLRSRDKEIVFIHPTDPLIRLQFVNPGDSWNGAYGRLMGSKPSPLRSGLGEFYFETARAISSITASKTIHDFPRLHWRISHGAGAFPCIADRFLLGFPDEAEEARKIYCERFWYDSAGPVYPRQIKGLLAYDIPVSQLVFGTDYPYGIGFWDVDANIAGLSNADFLSSEEKEGVFYRNSQELWKGSIKDL